MRPFLPEFDPRWAHPEAGPIRRPRYRGALGILPAEHREAAFQRLAAVERPRLIGGPGADPAVARPGSEIGVGLAVGDRRRPALDADLPAQRLPVKAQLGPRFREQLFGLAPFAVGIQ